MATSEQITEFKDLYDVAGLSDEEIAIIIGSSPGVRNRFDEQRLSGQGMRQKGRPAGTGGYDRRSGTTAPGGLLGLGADIFERYRGRKQEKEGIAGLEGLEGEDKERMKIYIGRMRQQAQAAKEAQAAQAAPPPMPAQGPMGPPAPGPQGPMGPPAPGPGQPPLGQPSPNIPMQPSPLANMPPGNVSIGDVPPPTPAWHPPMAPQGPNPGPLPSLTSPPGISTSIAEELRKRGGNGRQKNENSEMSQIANFLRMMGST